MPSGFFCVYGATGQESPVALCTALIRRGQAVRLYRDFSELKHDLRPGVVGEHNPPVVVLHATLAEVCEYASRLRSGRVALQLVAILPEISAIALSEALSSGVDICWHQQTSVNLIASSLVRGPQGKVALPDRAEGDVSWKLRARGWKVCAANGLEISLTTAERRVMQALVSVAEKRLAHGELLEVLSSEPSGIVENEATRRRLSLVMSRLRRKFLAAGVQPPFASVRGHGYELCVEFVVE